MKRSPVTCHTLEEFYHIDGHPFEKQHKESLSGYRDWDKLEHADEWLLFADNIGSRLAIDEPHCPTASCTPLRDAHTRGAGINGRRGWYKVARCYRAVLLRIDDDQRNVVREVTLDLSDSMRKIVRTAFPEASRVIDRFHIQKLAVTRFRSLESRHRWDAIQQANDEILNFYNHRSSNAMTESFNAKIKIFRANLRGVVDKKFFFFRIANLYAYPH